MQNLSNVYIWGSPFITSRTDAQNGVDIIFKEDTLYNLIELNHSPLLTMVKQGPGPKINIRNRTLLNLYKPMKGPSQI
jgi:hypothetical protein